MTWFAHLSAVIQGLLLNPNWKLTPIKLCFVFECYIVCTIIALSAMTLTIFQSRLPIQNCPQSPDVRAITCANVCVCVVKRNDFSIDDRYISDYANHNEMRIFILDFSWFNRWRLVFCLSICNWHAFVSLLRPQYL